MAAGKHVYCEKPITLTAEQAVEVRDAVKKFGKKTPGRPPADIAGQILECPKVNSGRTSRPGHLGTGKLEPQ